MSIFRPVQVSMTGWIVATGVLVLVGLVCFAALSDGAPTPIALGQPLPIGDPAQVARYEQSLLALRPQGPYVVVDSADNRLRLFSGDTELLETRCSTGKGSVLRDWETGRVWVFDTPIGVYPLREKVEDPVWVKPDWAFIEEGSPVPHEISERYDDVSLGDYGLYLGDGYIIHGTLFESLLGEPATHGCVRVGAKDLERLYREVPAGAPIILY